MPISVVIATYNRASLLRQCLAQLQIQAFEAGDEVIVVDNASSDGTAQVISSAAGAFPVPLRYLRESEPGKTAALNTGLAAARGDLLALTDDDLLVADDWIVTIRRLFQNPALGLVGGRVDPWWERPPPRWLRVEQDGRYTRMSSPIALFHYGEPQAFGARSAPGGNMVVRRHVLDTVGNFDPRLGRHRGTLLCGEDRDFARRVAAAGFQSEYRPELRVRHWVPAERTRLRYYARWFFWSGVTNALLDAEGPSKPRQFQGAPLSEWRRMMTAPALAVAGLLRGRLAEAASNLMDAAFAAGYIAQRLKERAAATGRLEDVGGRQEIRASRRQAPQLPATSQTPAVPIPGTSTGKLSEEKGCP